MFLKILAATGTSLMDLNGIGPSGAARLLVEVGDITRFPVRDHFASWNGTAPIDASSGDRSGTGCRGPGTARSTGPCTSWPPSSYATRPRAVPTTTGAKAGKTSMEAMRALKRRLSNIVYKTMLGDAIHRAVTAPGRAREGKRDTTLTPARPAHIPAPALRTSHFPDPPGDSLEPHSLLLLDTEGCLLVRAVESPTGRSVASAGSRR
jgi:transposase